MRIGAVPVPVNPMDRVDNYVYYLDDSYARVLVVERSLLDALEPELDARLGLHVLVVDGDPGRHASFDAVARDHAGDLEPPADTHREDMAFWLYSSGSTGRPKGVVHAHRDIGVTVDQYARNVLRIDAHDVCYSTTKLFHAYGLGNSLSFPLSVGACAGLVKGRSTPERIFEAVARYQPTLFFSVPALYAAMVKAPGAADVDFSSVRACVSAAEALPAAVLARWQALTGVPILDGIGSTELLHIYCSNTLEDLAPGTSGRAVPGYELRLVDEHGLDVAPGQPGDLMVRGDSCAGFYWHQRDKTRYCMRGEWFHTGDRYIVDADGHYVYQGRSDDMIKVGGLWVSPADVEACLVRHPAVSEAAVIGVNVEDLSRIKALVICAASPDEPDALADELRQWCKQHLRRYEYPHVVEFVEDLPRTSTGKVQRYKLREVEAVRTTLAGSEAAH
jgi:benzoate-CoA ligase family protein